jgi:histidine triad (HIT) family protein
VRKVDCIFCKIASGEIKSSFVGENDWFVAFDDINPVAPTHVLVVPRKHVKSLEELAKYDTECMRSFFELVEQIVELKGIKTSGYRLIVNQGSDSGQEVEHLHFHILGGRKLGRLG